jgi:ribosomal protein S18 acetylase RimI-like enzyme
LLPSGSVTPRRVDPVAEPATLEAMDAVMQQAYGVASFRSSIDRFAAVQPDGLAVVEDEGAVVGAGCCVAYPDGGFGWIGLVATARSHQRRGVATAVTEFLSATLAAHGAASVLDASAAGGPVYERMRFVDHGLTAVMSLPEDGALQVMSRDAARPLEPHDFDDVAAFNAVAFGASRRDLLVKLLEQQPGRAFVVRRGDAVSGYVVAQDGALGPVVADDGDVLAALVLAAANLPWASPPRINVPPESDHRRTLQALGFEIRRELRHMRRGIDVLPGRRAAIAGLVSLGEG